MEKNEIIDLLHWKNSEEDQQKGIEYALKEDDLWFVMENISIPDFAENCAKIFTLMDDKKLEPYLDELLTILQDVNYYGASTIYNHLLSYHGKLLYKPFILNVNTAKKWKYDNWLYWLASLLCNQELAEELARNDSDNFEYLKRINDKPLA